MDTAQRFWSKVNKTDTCWLWAAWHNQRGYGLINIGGKAMLAHRYSYELHKGKIKNNFVIDHLCRNPSCVNPDHLEAVTQRENLIRAVNHISQQRKNQTHCKHGHLLAGNNLYIRKDGRRNCKECKRLSVLKLKSQ